jgi:radical SAM protein with 4Fe4S-binding SPASM domain
LTFDEGRRLIDQTAEMGTPLLVLSGGDPASRPDLLELIRYGKSKGLRMATVPAATPRLTEEFIRGLKAAGADQVAFSLDFPTAERHDAFRGYPGAFQRTIQAVGAAGVPPQINTCVWKESAEHLEAMAALVESLGIVFWEVFFLVPVGRGTGIEGLTPDRCEELFEILRRVQSKKKFILKVTEAPHYRRYLRQHQEREHGRVRHRSQEGSVPMAQRGVNAGNGFLFVSHFGEIFPSGFLPLTAGSVRRDRLADVYQTSELFTSLRDPSKLKGKCGACPFASACGGSRSRAYALTGDPLESDPWCAFEP